MNALTPSRRRPRKQPPPSNKPPPPNRNLPQPPGRGSSASSPNLPRCVPRFRQPPLLRAPRPNPPPLPVPPPQPPALRSAPVPPGLVYVRRQLLKAVQVPVLEGKLDLQLVAQFIRRVELMATSLGMAPHNTTKHSNRTIQMPVGCLSDGMVQRSHPAG